MKKLLLLSALFIIACSSDDGSDTNDNSNQTFLERFDGVVWEDNELSEIRYTRINNDTTNFFTRYGDDFTGVVVYECSDWQYEVAESGVDITVTTNIENNFSYNYVYPEGDGGDTFIIARENGNVLVSENFYYSNYANQELHIIRYDTITKSSFEIPCN
jgi:hypothetical protein